MLSVDGLEQLIEPVLNEMGLGLHYVELKREGRDLVLRVVTDRLSKETSEDGVSIDELTEANHEIGAMLDLEDPIEERYRLTVESPGIERDLGSWRQLRYAAGERVRVVTRGENATVVEGKLLCCEEEPKVLVIQGDGGEVSVDYSAVKNARTVFEWPSPTEGKVKH